MASSRLCSLFSGVGSLLPLCASSLEKGSIYNLRNVADESYLRVESGGALCKYMGPVVTSSTLNSTSAAFRWRYAELTSDLKWLAIESNGDMLQDNELTMEPIAPYSLSYFPNT
ncbi:hypothetical protein Ocin01_16855 [Orchesella cincta]|uniref:Uncharacterized protein n=1 Tax=Orchesella cincta TaxID=48709 RepID=A0A1D2MAC7_ORCCI|nr:hypothetical protein Ocin01_16855 [Orchesella cincta]